MCLWFCEDIHSDLFSCYRSSFFTYTHKQTLTHIVAPIHTFYTLAPAHLLQYGDVYKAVYHSWCGGQPTAPNF